MRFEIHITQMYCVVKDIKPLRRIDITLVLHSGFMKRYNYDDYNSMLSIYLIIMPGSRHCHYVYPNSLFMT